MKQKYNLFWKKLKICSQLKGLLIESKSQNRKFIEFYEKILLYLILSIVSVDPTGSRA